MASSPWSRPHQQTITLDGVVRAVEVARLNVSRKANVQMCVAMLAKQNARMLTFADLKPLEQLETAKVEREVNGQLGAWIEEEIRESLRPKTPWLSASGIEVTDGASYVEAYDNDDLTAAFWAIYLANNLSETTRKNSSSPRDSADGSVDSTPLDPARGDAPAPTVAPVVAKASVTSAGVSVPLDSTSSGPTVTASLPTCAPSVL